MEEVSLWKMSHRIPSCNASSLVQASKDINLGITVYVGSGAEGWGGREAWGNMTTMPYIGNS